MDTAPPPSGPPPESRPPGAVLAALIGLLAGITDMGIVVLPVALILVVFGQGLMLLHYAYLIWPLFLFFPVFGLLRGLHHGGTQPGLYPLYRICRADLYRVGEIADPFGSKKGMGLSYYVHFAAGGVVAVLGMAAWTAPLWMHHVFK